MKIIIFYCFILINLLSLHVTRYYQLRLSLLTNPKAAAKVEVSLPKNRGMLLNLMVTA